MKNKNYKIDGLTTKEAKELLAKYGRNEIPMERPSRIKILLKRFWGLVPWMLELAIILDLVLRRWIEAIIIVTWLVFSALLGFYQEDKAQKALALLRQHLIINTRVRRDGTWQIIPASELVPGDFVHLSRGDVVPADIEITDGQIQVDQSQLTGESLPVEKKLGEIVYAGSLVTQGEAFGLVKATGAKTYFGKTAELVKLAKAPARLDILITRIAKYLGAIRCYSCSFSLWGNDCSRPAIDWSTPFYFASFNNFCSGSRANDVYYVSLARLSDVGKKRNFSYSSFSH
jgi:H+-transporting ATPase